MLLVSCRPFNSLVVFTIFIGISSVVVVIIGLLPIAILITLFIRKPGLLLEEVGDSVLLSVISSTASMRLCGLLARGRGPPRRDGLLA